MRGRELIFALAAALGGIVLGYAVRELIGDRLTPVVYYSIVIVGLGAALVVVRYGRLGPYGGELGPPRLEAELRQRIIAETERARRYGRELTVLAVRQESGRRSDWAQEVRGADYVVRCRKGLVILLLPETPRDRALIVLRHINEHVPHPIRAALVNFPGDGHGGDDVSALLLRLVRESLQPGKVVMRTQGNITAYPIVA